MDICQKMGISNQFKFDNQKNVIHWKNGSTIVLKDLFLYPSDPNFDSLGSLEITYAFIDECNQVAFKAWSIVKSRLRYKLRDFAPNGELTKNLKVYAYEYVIEGFRTYENIDGKVISYKNVENEYVELDNVIPNYKSHLKVACEWVQSDGVITQGLLGKILGTCNPAKNWTYNEFYFPDKTGSIKPHRKFIQALPKDNPFLPASYIENLMNQDFSTRKRLLEGDWDYDDNPNALFDREDILGMYTNTHIEEGKDEYITCDIAYQGSDKFVMGYWRCRVLVDIKAIDKISETQISKEINDFRLLKVKNEPPRRVPVKNVIYDADGLKMFVRESAISGFLKGATQFHNGAKPLKVKKENENFTNLKSQCAFKLAELVANSEIYIKCEKYKELLIEEFGQIYKMPRNDEGKLGLESKKDTRERLGRSYDFYDMCNMRMFFELKEKSRPRILW